MVGSQSRRYTFPENPLMLKHRVAVSHASDVIAHGAVQPHLTRLPAGLLADFLRVLQIKTEKFPQKLLRPDVGLVDDRIEVKIFVKVTPEFDIQLAALRAVSDEGFRTTPHIVG